MLNERYHINDDGDFSHVLPELIAELVVIQKSMCRAYCRDEVIEGEEMLGVSLCLDRIIRDFDFINQSLYGRPKPAASEAHSPTISKNEG